MGHKKLVLTSADDTYPAFLKGMHPQSVAAKESDVPVIISMADSDGAGRLEQLVVQHSDLEVVDNYAEQYAELLLSRNAHLYRAKYDIQVASIAELLEAHYAGKAAWQMGSWVYFPWRNQVVHVLAQSDFEDLRTIRNRD